MKHVKREPMWRRYLRFFGPNVAADVNDEVDDHIARLESELRATGTPDAEIAATVRARFGDPDAIRARLRRADDLRYKRSLWIDAFGNFGQDVAYALRRLKQRPGFTAAVVIVLALGVGATTAMFSAVDAAMLRPLPFPHADRLVLLYNVSMPGVDAQPGYHRPDFNDVSAMTGVFSHVADYVGGEMNLRIPNRPLRVQVGLVTPSFFATMGVSPAVGRGFTIQDGAPGAPEAVVLSNAFWRGTFGARPMLDSTIALGDHRYVVVGVMPPGFSFPSRSDLWIPMTISTIEDPFSGFRSTGVDETIGRLADGVTVAGAWAALEQRWNAAGASIAPADSNQRRDFQRELAGLRAQGFAQPLRRELVGNDRTPLLVLLGATGLLLLIACANVTNLLLSQAAVRRREIAVRAVLGATRGRVVRQLLTESVMLAVAGTTLGVLLAPAALHMVSGMMPPSLAGLAPAELNGRVLVFAAALAVITGVGFGLWPAFGAARTELNEAVKGGSGHGTTAAGTGRARRALLGVELALTVSLLVGAGLMLRSFSRLMRVDSGVQPAHVATLQLSFDDQPPSGGATPAQVAAMFAGARAGRAAKLTAILVRLRNVPGIEAAGASGNLPLDNSGGMVLYPLAKGMRPARPLDASEGYFRAMGIPVLQGRTFTSDDDALAPPVVVVDRVLADSMWPAQNPIGRQIALGADHYTVVGVVGTVRQSGLNRRPFLQLYFPIYVTPPQNLVIAARGTLPPAALFARMRDAVRAVDSTQAVYAPRMMGDVISESVAPQRTNAMLITLFGALALVLTTLGVYAVLAYSVAQRRRELGIRAALGATSSALVGLVAKEMLWVAVVGIAAGLAVAWGGARVMSSLLYGVGIHDMATYIAAPLALVITAAIATLIPARRAARTNPVDVIRED